MQSRFLFKKEKVYLFKFQGESLSAAGVLCLLIILKNQCYHPVCIYIYIYMYIFILIVSFCLVEYNTPFCLKF